MRHPEYEQLLFEQSDLDQGDRARLEAHLQECVHCAQLSDRWVMIEDVLVTAPSMPAPRGFLTRFQARLENARHQRQARLLLMTTILIIAGILAVVGLLGWGLLSYGATIFSWFLKAFNQVHWVATVVDVFTETLILLLETVAEQLPLVIWMAVSGAISVLVLTWVTSFYRLSYRVVGRE